MDTFIQTGLTIALLLVGFAAVFTVPLLVVLCVLAWLVMAVAYFPHFWSTTGQTPGMKMLRIKVVRDLDGGPVSIGQAILRLIGYWVSRARCSISASSGSSSTGAGAAGWTSSPVRCVISAP